MLLQYVAIASCCCQHLKIFSKTHGEVAIAPMGVNCRAFGTHYNLKRQQVGRESFDFKEFKIKLSCIIFLLIPFFVS